MLLSGGCRGTSAEGLAEVLDDALAVGEGAVAVTVAVHRPAPALDHVVAGARSIITGAQPGREAATHVGEREAAVREVLEVPPAVEDPHHRGAGVRVREPDHQLAGPLLVAGRAVREVRRRAVALLVVDDRGLHRKGAGRSGGNGEVLGLV